MKNNHLPWPQSILICTVPLAFACALAAAATPAAPAPGPTWGASPTTRSAAGTTANSANWSAASAAITAKNGDLVAQGPPGSKFLLIGQDVWNLQTLAKTGKTLPINGQNRDPVALSADGKLLAIGYNKDLRGRSPDANRPGDIDVTVWDTATANKVCEIPSIERDIDFDYLGLASNKYLLISGHGTGQRPRVMEVWDAQTGKRVRRFACNFGNANATSISPDGRYIAIGDSRAVQVYDLGTGQSVATMNAPASPPNTDRPGMVVVSFPNINELQFSPDGASIAALSSFQTSHVIAWDNHGTLTEDLVCPTGAMEFNPSGARTLQWSPDGKAWLLNQHWLVDRKSKLVVWNIQFPFGDYARSLFLDPDRLLVMHSSPNNNSETLTIPWADIRKALDLMASKNTSLALCPGQSVSIDIECVNPRGDVPATKAALLKSMTTRLEREGIKVADGSPTVIKMRFEEGVSEPPSAALRSARPDLAQRTSDARSILTFDITVPGKTKPLFTDSVRGQSTGNRTGSEGARQDMMRVVDLEISRLVLPYMLSKDDKPLMLPLGIAPHEPPKNFLFKEQPDDSPPSAPKDPKVRVEGA